MKYVLRPNISSAHWLSENFKSEIGVSHCIRQLAAQFPAEV